VTDKQVRSWLSGTFQIPTTVSFILSALEQKLISQDWLVDALQIELKENT
jgi:hypothetical protein